MAEIDSGERKIFAAYVCARCDTDFGINTMGCGLKTYTYGTKCPVCGYNKFYVYYVVTDKPITERPPLMKEEELQQSDKENGNDSEW